MRTSRPCRIAGALLAAVLPPACQSAPLPSTLDPAGRAVVMVTAPPLEVFRQGEISRTVVRQPSIDALSVGFICLEEFDGRSAEVRAAASMRYLPISQTRAVGYLVNPRIKGMWRDQIRAQSVAGEGCDPDYTRMTLQMVSHDADELARFLETHPEAQVALDRSAHGATVIGPFQ
jgi:hypothetical protein